jgi:hypothetical protein
MNKLVQHHLFVMIIIALLTTSCNDADSEKTYDQSRAVNQGAAIGGDYSPGSTGANQREYSSDYEYVGDKLKLNVVGKSPMFFKVTGKQQASPIWLRGSKAYLINSVDDSAAIVVDAAGSIIDSIPALSVQDPWPVIDSNDYVLVGTGNVTPPAEKPQLGYLK